ncbi:PcfJ domain-containing protein [Endozoicomonas ascidiicola]|uniref:PcfJ domain-containing protein n=1 Tax=Endozoicomonas ascidiicola TaxID=1698521 RepID=UPI000833C062|nr:PcfJ domain-containing protein [Endozoicomonas ascidiicola]
MLATNSQHASNANNTPQTIHWNKAENRLEIDWTETLGYPCRLVVYGWEQGLEWHTELSDDIHQPVLFAEPGINLINPTSSPAIRQWQSTIPEDLITILQPFRLWSFSLLQMANQWQEMSDLLRSNPILIWLAREYMDTHKLSNGQFREMLNLKQHQILGAMGLAATKSSVRAVKRIQLESYIPSMSELVRQLWRQPSLVTHLRHQQKIDRPLMRLLQRLPWIAGRPLANTLDAIDCHWQYEELIQLVTDTCRMSGNNPDTQERLAGARSFNAVENIHNRVVDEYNDGRHHGPGQFTALLDEHGEPLPFPKPPHPGTSEIKPILTPADLADEGDLMRHCVASYTRRIQEGEYFVYHMDHPQPLTIGVKVRNGAVTGYDQIKGIRNHSAEKEANDIVMSWIKNLLNAREF